MSRSSRKASTLWLAVCVLLSTPAALALPVPDRTPADAGADAPVGECTAYPHEECPERCPTFNSCFVSEGDGSLYYQVDEQRLECDGLDCLAASQRLADYCCERGEFAPSSDGGCALASPPGRAGATTTWYFGLLALLLGLRRRELSAAVAPSR